MDGSVETEFVAFVADRAHTLRQAAHLLAGDRHAAEDLVQGALAKAFVAWRRIHGAPEPYVRRILYRDHVSRWRAVGRRELSMAEPPERVGSGGPDGDVALRVALRDALRHLPPRDALCAAGRRR